MDKYQDRPPDQPSQNLNPDEATKAARDHAWEWFKFHAAQRMTTFNFFLILTGAITAGFISSLTAKHFAVACSLGVLEIVVVCSFYQLDQRSKQLIKLSEKYICMEQSRLCLLLQRKEILFIELAETDRSRLDRRYFYSFGQIFRVLFVIVFLFALAASSFALWQHLGFRNDSKLNSPATLIWTDLPNYGKSIRACVKIICMDEKRLIPGIDYIGFSVAFYCHNGEGKFLFQKRGSICRDYVGMWDCGGGQIEFGEKVDEALRRELLEEYGCEGHIDQQLPAVSFISTSEGRISHWITMPFIIRINGEDVKIQDGLEKIQEVGWFSVANLPEPLHPGVLSEIDRFKPYFRKFA